jgi:hypothetical protein
LTAEWRLRGKEPVDAEAAEVEPQPKRQRTAVDFLGVGDLFRDLEETTPAKPKKENELSRFRDTPPSLQGDDFNPLVWWKERAELFPVLSGIAWSTFGVRPTSANVERFSAPHAG